jgi:peptidyl-prolyl cis-trans isomerase C
MTHKNSSLAVLALLLMVSFPIFADETAAPAEPPAATAGAGTVVATVNGTEITLGILIIARAALPPEYQSLPDDLIYGGLLDQVIQQVVIEQSLEGKLTRAEELTLLNDRRTYLSTLMVQQVAEAAVSEAAVLEAYEEAFAEFKSEKEFRASHILVDSEDKAKALLAEIEAGADFASVAAANSTDGSAQAGGDLGWFGLGMMVEPFEAAVVAARVGKVTGPVQTEFGFHLILVTETRNSEKPQLETVRAQIEAGVQKTAVLDMIEAMVAGAVVEKTAESIDPALLKDLSLLEK